VKQASLFKVLLLAVSVALLGSCSLDAGVSHLEVKDMSGYPAQFEAATREMKGELIVHENGCVNVISGGVERVPFWPNGTTVTQDSQDMSLYVLTLPGDIGVFLVGPQQRGDSFTARARTAPALPDAPVTEGKAEGFVRYCSTQGEAIAFEDLASFMRTTR
jgi:hypothetical protein